jgi:hypothetical protein
MMAAALADGETVLENAARARDPRPGRDADQDGRADRRHGTTASASGAWSACTRPRAPPHRARPHRGRHLPVRGGGHRRRRGAARRPCDAPGRGDRQAARGRRDHHCRRGLDPHPGHGAAQGGQLPHHRIPGFPTDMQAQFMASTAWPRARRGSPRPSSRTASCTSTS